MSIRSYFMARFYDATMTNIEAACLSEWRSELLSNIKGNVLEIGSGTGGNLVYYPESVNSLVLTEPDPHMLKLLKKKTEQTYSGAYNIESYQADAVHFPDASFDSVVSTLVLCSVKSPSATIMEINRVLKPGGRLYFIEHVRADQTPHLIKWQRLIQPFWKFMCGNCHLTRDTESNITDQGLIFEQLIRLKSSGSPAIVSPTIMGIAKKL